MIKKILCSLVIIFSLHNFFSTEDILIIKQLIQNKFLSISFFNFNFDARDILNKKLDNDGFIIKNIFIETLYMIFLESELKSYEAVFSILGKTFSSLWIVAETSVRYIVEIFYLAVEIFKKVLFRYKIFVTISFLFVLLFYIKTHLKTYRFATIVLRC
ncbi:MAG: hypothetical protein N2643_01620 [Endomicrobia bacterium]|nr:hypothetical protein [Endomicrobiia bacterium]